MVRLRFEVAAALLVAASGPAVARAYRVEAESLVVRAGPGPDATPIGRVFRSQVYPGLRDAGAWRAIQLGERVGFVKDAGLSPSDLEVKAVVSRDALVRSGPGTRYRALGPIQKGDVVAIAGETGEWRLVFHEGRRAFINEAHLRDDPPRPRSRAGFVMLASSGPGFYGYTASHRRWGTPRLIYAMERIGIVLEREDRAPMRVGDVSLVNGGEIDGHASHERGVDVDVGPARDAGAGPVNRFMAAYSRAGTQRMIDLFVREVRVQFVFFNDPGTRHTTRWPNHDDHFHVRVY